MKNKLKPGIVALILTTVPFIGKAGEKEPLHVFPELGYAFDALEPTIDAKTMELHYTKHHRGYYDKFMDAAKKEGLLDVPVEKIFARIGQYSETIRNNGGGYYNHVVFWKNLSPEKQEVPGKLKSVVEKDFGSWDAFREQFENAAKNRFGSGWAWLSVGDDGKLFVSSTANQDNPLMETSEKRGTPILALDVWEHAYYLKYQNRRPEYIENFWNVVNWKEVLDRYENAVK
jgi:Fe-Mn family superoxide dismutase